MIINNLLKIVNKMCGNYISYPLESLKTFNFKHRESKLGVNSINGLSHNNTPYLIVSQPPNHSREDTMQCNIVIWDAEYTISRTRFDYDNTIWNKIIRYNIKHTKKCNASDAI